MLEISFDKHRSPVKAALLYLVLWELATVIIWLFTAKLFVIYPLFAVGFTVVYPVCTWWACYRHAKNYGLKWYVAPVMIAVSVIEYIFVEEARSVVPNFIVLTVLTAGFAAGIGNCFADKDAINAAKEDKKRKKLKKNLNTRTFWTIIKSMRTAKELSAKRANTVRPYKSLHLHEHTDY